MQTKIIYEDGQVLVCHKPAGLATQSGKIGQQDVVSELKNYLMAGQKTAQVNKQNRNSAQGSFRKAEKMGGTPYLGVVHRLDQPVEGLLVFAKTKEAAAKLTTQLAKGSLNKRYYALVCGKPSEKEGELVDYLVKDGNMARVSENGKVDTEAKKAVLQYQLVSGMMTNVSEVISLLDIHIDTGRFHQIRVQMSHAGLPLLGDSKYGSEYSMNLSRKLGIRNVALYAYGVEFLHPVTGKKLEFSIQPQFPACIGNIS